MPAVQKCRKAQTILSRIFSLLSLLTIELSLSCSKNDVDGAPPVAETTESGTKSEEKGSDKAAEDEGSGGDSVDEGHAGNGSSSSSPSLSYEGVSGINAVRNQSLTLTPSVLAAGHGSTISSCTISGTSGLPSGLAINGTTCVISGTPTQTLNLTSYTITVTNSQQLSSSTQFNVKVSDAFIDAGSSSSTGFGAGASLGLAWDTNGSYLRLGVDSNCSGTTSNCIGYNSGWFPQSGSLVSYWSMNNQLNDSKGNHQLSLNGDAHFSTTAKLGSHAAEFDGTGDFISIPYSASLNPASFTISAWARPTGGQGTFRAVISSRKADFNASYIIYASAANYWSFWTTDGSTFDIDNSTSPVNLDQWVHIVASYDGPSKSKKLYINGDEVLDGTHSGTYATNDSADILIGAGTEGAVGAQVIKWEFTGQIDDVAIWSSVLNLDEIQAITSRQSYKYGGTYTSRVFDKLQSNSWTGFSWLSSIPFGKELTGDANNSSSIDSNDSEKSTEYPALSTNSLMNGLVRLYHFNENSGTNTDDASSYDFDGTSQNGATLGALGILGKAAGFDGTDDHISAVTTNLPTGSQNWTVSAWVYPTIIDGNRRPIVAWGSEGNGESAGIYLRDENGTNGWGCYHFSDGLDLLTDYDLKTHKWYHLACTYDGTTSRLYIDGKLQTSGSRTLNVANGGNTFVIGRNQSLSSSSFAGKMDELAIWSRALPATEVLEVYRRAFNRIDFQVRTCSNPSCSDNPSWLGINGSNSPPGLFSELQNNTGLTPPESPTGLVKVGRPSLSFDAFPSFTVPANQYFQYRVFLDSNDAGTSCDYGTGSTWCSPELKSVTIVP